MLITKRGKLKQLKRSQRLNLTRWIAWMHTWWSNHALCITSAKIDILASVNYHVILVDTNLILSFFEFQAFIVNLGFLLYLRPVKYRRDKTAPIDGLELKSLQKGKPTTTPQMSESEKWQTFALILDRIYFLVFLPVLVICFCVTFPSPINLFRLWFTDDYPIILSLIHLGVVLRRIDRYYILETVNPKYSLSQNVDPFSY